MCVFNCLLAVQATGLQGDSIPSFKNVATTGILDYKCPGFVCFDFNLDSSVQKYFKSILGIVFTVRSTTYIIW